MRHRTEMCVLMMILGLSLSACGGAEGGNRAEQLALADFFVRRLSVSERVRSGERRRGQARPATAGTDGGQGAGQKRGAACAGSA